MITRLSKLKLCINWLNKYFVLIFCLIFGLSDLHYEYNKPTIKSKKDLLELNATLENYSFKRNTGYKRRGRSYYLWTEEYNCTFQIPADFIRYFLQTDFERKFGPGKKFKLTIPKDYRSYLDDEKRNILIYSLEDENQNYLDGNLTFSNERNNSDYKFGVFIILLGIGIHYYRNRMKTYR